MRRTSTYYPLRWVVECKPEGQAFFETIAAFNDGETVAIGYAKDCAKANPTFGYRVKERQGSRGVWKTIFLGDARQQMSRARRPWTTPELTRLEAGSAEPANASTDPGEQ